MFWIGGLLVFLMCIFLKEIMPKTNQTGREGGRMLSNGSTVCKLYAESEKLLHHHPLLAGLRCIGAVIAGGIQPQNFSSPRERL